MRDLKLDSYERTIAERLLRAMIADVRREAGRPARATDVLSFELRVLEKILAYVEEAGT